MCLTELGTHTGHLPAGTPCAQHRPHRRFVGGVEQWRTKPDGGLLQPADHGVALTHLGEPTGVMIEGEYAGDLALDHVKRAFAVHHRMDAQFVLAQLDADLVEVAAVQAERQPHDAVELLLACADAGGAHPLTEAEQRRFGQRELTHRDDREATGSHTAMMPWPTDNQPPSRSPAPTNRGSTRPNPDRCGW